MLTTSELILLLLKKNPSLQFTRNELANILKKKKMTIDNHIRRLKKQGLIIVKKPGRFNLVQWNDPSIIELPKLVNPERKVEQVYIPKKIRFQVNQEIYVPKKTRDQLNWEKGSTLLFIEKNENIFVIVI